MVSYNRLFFYITIQFALFSITILEYIIYSFYNIKAEYIIEILSIQLLLFYIWSILSAKNIWGWKSLYLFFLYTIAIFLFMRIFLNILGISFEVFYYATKWINFYFLDSTAITLLFLFLFSITLIHLGALLAELQLYKKIIFLHNQVISHSKFIFRIGSFSFWIIFPITLIKLMLQIKFVLSNGYYALYAEEISLPFWMKGSGTLLLISYSIILMSKPQKRMFILFSSLFLLIQAGILFQGARGGFIVSLFVSIWYYYKFYTTKDIKLFRFIMLGLALVIISQVIAVIRSSESDFYFNNIIDLIRYFLYEQGTSIQVPMYMIEYSDYIHSNTHLYILYPLLSLGVISPSQTLDTLYNYSFLGHHLTYFINPDAYLSGEGIGSSFIAEIYELPLLIRGIILLCIGYLTVLIDKVVIYNRLLLLLAYSLSYSIIWMPRGQLLPNINIIIPLCLVYLIIKALLHMKNVNEAHI